MIVGILLTKYDLSHIVEIKKYKKLLYSGTIESLVCYGTLDALSYQGILNSEIVNFKDILLKGNEFTLIRIK